MYFFRFSDLLALAEDIVDLKSTRVLRGLPGRRAAAAAASTSNQSSGSSKSTKNRKLVIDDSDSESSSSEVCLVYLYESLNSAREFSIRVGTVKPMVGQWFYLYWKCLLHLPLLL